MNKQLVVAALAVGGLSAPLFAEAPPPPGYRVGDSLRLFVHEYRVTGPGVSEPGEGCYLVCTYSTRPVVMVYAREINPPLIRLIKKLDEATRNHKDERLGSYVVLFCDSQDHEKKLKALAEKENIKHTLLAMVVINERALAAEAKAGRAGLRGYRAKLAPRAEITVTLATRDRRVRASYTYRKGELKDKDTEQILADLPRIFPERDSRGNRQPAR
jgi:hypothetical protein